MTDRLTDAELAAIRQRVDAAAAGPWEHVQPEFRDHTSQTVKGAAGQVVAFAGYGLKPMPPWRNAEFIAHAREDVLDLLRHIDALEAERAEGNHYYAAAYRGRNGQIVQFGVDVMDREYAEREVAEVNAQEEGTDEEPMFLVTRFVGPWVPVEKETV